MKLDGKQDLNVLYQVCVFLAEQKTKISALANSSTKVAYFTHVHDMWPFGILVKVINLKVMGKCRVHVEYFTKKLCLC